MSNNIEICNPSFLLYFDNKSYTVMMFGRPFKVLIWINISEEKNGKKFRNISKYTNNSLIEKFLTVLVL